MPHHHFAQIADARAIKAPMIQMVCGVYPQFIRGYTSRSVDPRP